MPEQALASRIPHEALVSLRHRLATLPARHPDRKHLVANAAALYGLSRSTLYRGLRQQPRPKPLHRADRGRPKVAAAAELERWCETIAAMKLRTLNGKGRHLSTAGAIRILEEHGVETPDGPVRLPPGLLSKPTANRYLRQWGYDHDRMTRQPAAVRFQAEHSNALWHFDLSPSDLKHVEEVPAWVEPGRGAPTLMIYSVVDDRSGVAYQEYRCVYGEDVEKRVTVSKSLAVDKDRASLTTLITALFYDLSPEKDPRIPAQSEHRERALRDLVRKTKRPVVLFVDEAHDLHHKTLSGLKRLREVVADGDGVLSIVLAGHPRLRNALMRPNMEEVGFRFAVFPFEGMAGHQAGYIAWLLGRCLRDGADPASVIEADAVELLAARLRTPLQVERYLAMAFEETHRIGERTVTAAVVEAVLSRQLDDLEPRLTRHGYDVCSIADEFRVKPADVRLFLQGQLDPARTRELTEQMLVAGLPV